MPPMPLEADALPDLVTPLTARPAASASQARRSSSDVEGTSRSSRSRSANSRASSDGIGETDIFVVGRDAGHRDRPLGKLGDAIAGNIVGRDHGLALPDQYAQSDIIAFGALGFLDAAIAHFDALRDAAHRNRIGGVRARALCGLDQPLRQRRERRLIEQVGGRVGSLRKRRSRWMVKSSQTKSLTLKRAGNASRQGPSDVPDSQGFQAFCVAKCQTFSAFAQGLVNHARQGLVNHAARSRAGDVSLTSLFKAKRKSLG